VRIAAVLAIFSAAISVLQGPATKPIEKNSQPTFYRDVLPILQNHCQSCHRAGEVAPMPLVTYEQTRPWANAMANAVVMKMMPPWFADPRYGHLANDPSLSENEIVTLSSWAKAGAPSGDPRDAPPERKWTQAGTSRSPIWW
jgi:hypothetical protein